MTWIIFTIVHRLVSEEGHCDSTIVKIIVNLFSIEYLDIFAIMVNY